MVIDARTGEVLHARNSDARLHPASLTKMMTLYVVFEAVERGEISLDTLVTISPKAAAEPPSKLGLRAGQKIKLRYLIRAAAVKSANDAATALGEAISGSEAAFARRMNRTAKALGMSRTTFKNMHGLTEEGHLSTARDMTTLGRHLFYDYPQYYNLFSRTTTDAGIREVANTNRRLLGAYKGADGIKTGYTRAAGFNLVASAERGGERIIATVFGGRSSAARNQQVAELLDLGFQRAPSRVAVRVPQKPAYVGNVDADPGTAGKTIRLVTAVARSPRPAARPGAPVPPEAVEQAVAVAVARLDATPVPRPEDLAAQESAPRVVTRLSTSGGRHWGITVGRYGSEYEAQRVLLQTALMELGTLDEALRKVVRRSGGFDANFVGLSEETAELACRRLTARSVECDTFGPG
jgi:D-alanyl-D-alanine carboxypeptidase